MEQKLRDVLEQYIEGAITAREFINYTLTQIEEHDPKGYEEYVDALQKMIRG